ncbi:dihydrodipicolinate synthase family protein [Planctomicrobium sp. SH661]|uniref:dihydrodipicolinate synthase family protein n=1 Tax=Planctomicrobium sp. SH661 TaxID=3448124 RepID=UPI003F5BF068
MSKPRFHGIIPPLVTPLANRDQLDFGGLHRLVDHQLQGGVHGLFLLGTTGEAPGLSYRLRRELITRVCRQVEGRVPVLVGVTDTAFEESIHLARHAADAGADAVVLAAPYYFPAGQTELTSYVQHLVNELPLPLMLYNMPSLTKIWFEFETVQKLSELERIVGIKDSSGDLEYFKKLISIRSLRPEWSFMIGQEVLLPDAVQMGGNGAVAGGANVLPQLFVDCYHAAVTNDTEQLAELMPLIRQFQKIYEVGKYGSRFIKATKCALSLLEICDDFMAEPFQRFHPADREQLRQLLNPVLPYLHRQRDGIAGRHRSQEEILFEKSP